MAPAKLIVTVAAVVLFAQLQCVAACAADLCGANLSRTESVPPCHKHHNHSHDQAPASCSFHLTVTQATSPHTPQLDEPVLSALGLAATASAILPLAGDSWVADLSDPSPPGMTALQSSTVLRV